MLLPVQCFLNPELCLFTLVSDPEITQVAEQGLSRAKSHQVGVRFALIPKDTSSSRCLTWQDTYVAKPRRGRAQELFTLQWGFSAEIRCYNQPVKGNVPSSGWLQIQLLLGSLPGGPRGPTPRPSAEIPGLLGSPCRQQVHLPEASLILAHGMLDAVKTGIRLPWELSPL